LYHETKKLDLAPTTTPASAEHAQHDSPSKDFDQDVTMQVDESQDTLSQQVDRSSR